MATTKIKALDGPEFGAYIATPKEQSAPGLIVIHDIFGVNGWVRSLCDSYAEKGFLVIAPDLFWRIEPGADIDESNTEGWTRAFDLYKRFDVEAGVRDLLATLAYIRRAPGCSGVVGAMGASLGGKLAFLMSSRSDVDCSVSVCGMGLETMLDEISDIRMPLIVLIGENDKFVPVSVRARITRSIEMNPVIQAQVYPGAGHAFIRPSSQGYNVRAAAQASEKIDLFFDAFLRNKKSKGGRA